MKKTILVAVITTLVTNFLLASPTLLFFVTWGLLGYITLQLEKYLTEKEGTESELTFKENPGWCIATIIFPPPMLIALLSFYWDSITEEVKNRLPKLKLPKIRSPFTW